MYLTCKQHIWQPINYKTIATESGMHNSHTKNLATKRAYGTEVINKSSFTYSLSTHNPTKNLNLELGSKRTRVPIEVCPTEIPLTRHILSIKNE
jgi:hypothetical protein